MPKPRKKGHAPGTVIIGVAMREEEKKALFDRAEKIREQRRTSMTASDLVRLAIFHQEKRGWKDIPEARIDSE